MIPLSYNPLTGKFASSNGGNESTQVTPIELRLENGCIEWRLAGLDEWVLLCCLSDLISYEVSQHLAGQQLLLNDLSASDYIKKSDISPVAFSGNYVDLEGKPTLGTVVSLDISDIVTYNDTRLTDPREWIAETISDQDLEDGTNKERKAWTVEAIWKTLTAWWNHTRDKIKLEGISDGATANQSDSFLLNRVNHTGAQPATTITGLSKVAITGNYNHLSGRPFLGEASKLNIGTIANSVAAGNDTRFVELQKNLDQVTSVLDTLQIQSNSDGSIVFGSGLFTFNNLTSNITLAANTLEIKGLHMIPALSRDEGKSTCGVALYEISNDTDLISSTGTTDNHTVPTQHAIKSYLGHYYTKLIEICDDDFVSTYTTTHTDPEGYLFHKQNIEFKTNQANGLAQLNSEGLIPSYLLPSYIDDVLEFSSLDKFPTVGEISFIYVSLDTKRSYRWSGSTYIEIPSSYGTTDQIVEGVNHKYCTHERVRQSISVSGSLQYDSSNGNIYYSTPNSDAVEEGSKNLYFTKQRVYDCISVSPSSGLTFNLKTGLIDKAFLTDKMISQNRKELYLDEEDTPLFKGLSLGQKSTNQGCFSLGGAQCSFYSEITSRNNRCLIDVNIANHFYLKSTVNKSIAFDFSNLELIDPQFCWTGCVVFEYNSGIINWFESSIPYQVKWTNQSNNNMSFQQGLNQVQIKVYSGRKEILLSLI